MLPCCVAAQQQYTGDTTVVVPIEKIASRIYKNADTTIVLITKKNFIKIPSTGTSITSFAKNKIIDRIVIVSTTADGVFAEEYYIDKGELVFVFQSFEYFNEVQVDNPRNFRGMKFWECRYYLEGEKVLCETFTGKKETALNYSAKELIEQGKKIKAYLVNYLANRYK